MEENFTPHSGGRVRLIPGTEVDVLHRDGSLSLSRIVTACEEWRHLGTPCDIVGYRVIASPRTASIPPDKEPA